MAFLQRFKCSPLLYRRLWQEPCWIPCAKVGDGERVSVRAQARQNELSAIAFSMAAALSAVAPA